MSRRPSWWLVGATLVAAAGCAHTEEDWQAQVHAVDDLKAKLEGERTQAKQARVELAQSTAKVEQIEQQLKAAGVDVASLGANLETQARASEEHRRRREQLDAIKRRFELLRAKLGPLAERGLLVTVRNNRVTIQLPADTLFDAGRETLKRDGREMLLHVAEAIRGEPALSSRAYQVVAHPETTAPGGRFKDGVGLSIMRAHEVLAVLLQPVDKGGGGLNPSRWSAASHGDVDPVPSTDGPSGQPNRRCEIVLQPAVEEGLDLRALLQ